MLNVLPGQLNGRSGRSAWEGLVCREWSFARGDPHLIQSPLAPPLGAAAVGDIRADNHDFAGCSQDKSWMAGLHRH